MRELTATLESALENLAGAKPMVKAVIEPSRIYFDAITANNPWSGADASGILDEPTLQDIAYSPADDLLVTFLNDAGDLKYAKQGNASKVSLSLAIDGKPGVHSDRLYRISSGSVYRHVITWTSGPSLGAGTNVNTPAEVPLVAHGVSATRCAVLTDADGGLRPVVIDNTTARTCPYRFMFPSAIDYGDTRTMLSMATFSGAAELDGKVYIYVSNCQKGWVEGISWDSSNNTWSDIFIAVPTELQTSLCEFRVSNVYSHESMIYLCGHFNRTDSIENPAPCTLLCYSRDGKAFALDRFTLVSDLGYRFLSTVGNDTLYLGNCNRVCHSPVVYTFNGTGTGHLQVEITRGKIHRFTDSSLSRASLELTAGDEIYAQHGYIRAGSRVKVYIGYYTASEVDPEEYILYGTYIIDEPDESIADGGRQFSLNLIHESQWKMRGLTMPFYTEIIGKSSVFDTGEQEGNLTVAPGSFSGQTAFSIDFWQSDPYIATGITGINLLWNGGVAPYTFAALHTSGFKTKEIKTVLNLSNNPLITGTAVFELHGWSRSDDAGNVNDEVRLLVVYTDEDGSNEAEAIYTGGSGTEYRWQNTYPGTEAGSYPITVNVAGLTGKRIKNVGMIWYKDGASVSYASRIDVTSGVIVEENFDDPNTPWDVQDGGGYLLPSSARPYMMFTTAPYNAWNFQMEAEFEITVEGGLEGFPVSAGLVGLAENGSNYMLGRYDKVTDKFEVVKGRDGQETTLVSTAANITVGDTLRILFEHRNGRFSVYAQDSLVWVLQAYYDWTATDGWMFTSDTVSPRCGIYGYIAVPSFKIVGLNVSVNDEDQNGTEAVGHLPLESIADFPASGTIRIGDDLFTYGEKVSVALVRGPYQLRTNGLYSPPYGSGYGMEVTHFNWTAATDALLYSVIAIDAGHGFINSSVLWQIFITTDGQVEWLRNRARYYSFLPGIGENTYSNANRVYSTGGLKYITAASESPSRHSLGERAFLELEGSIICKWVSGSSGEEDTTVADLISRTTALAGTNASFLGELQPYLIISMSEIGSHDYPDGFDLHFTCDTIASLIIRSDIAISGTSQTHNKIVITHAGAGAFLVSLYACDSDGSNATLLESKPFTSTTDSHNYRILFHDNSASVYMDSAWVYTFILEEIVYGTSLTVDLDTDTTLSDVRYVELCDWREAIYIDLETDALSALGSIIQERPVETGPQSDGSIAYWYSKIGDPIPKAINSRQYRLRRPSPLDASSDSIIYGIIDVGVVRHLGIAKEVGFSTRVHRFSNLDQGAIRASKIIQQRKYEALEMHEILVRIDPRIEIGDTIEASFVASGTGRVVSSTFIAESVELDYNDNSMRVMGRGFGL